MVAKIHRSTVGPVADNLETWAGGPIGDSVTCVLAGNPGPMTLDGTNTWVVSPPGSDSAIIIDPGPDDVSHLEAVVAAARGRRISDVLITHGHPDHTAGARAFSELTGAPVHAADPAHRHGGGDGLDEGRTLEAGDLRLEVLRTPGHTDDSLSILLPEIGALLTGDSVLGRGTAVIAWPDGRLGPYLESLQRLRDQADGLQVLLPGHGPVLDRPVEVLEFYLAHRQARLEQVRAAVAAGAQTARAVVETVYSDVDPSLWPAAELSVEAQLEYLRT
jgi:glyoxylase-like metal-dependent hydrolase (beta-lactamase superfamily II)